MAVDLSRKSKSPRIHLLYNQVLIEKLGAVLLDRIIDVAGLGAVPPG
jgi:hypothetical protein